MGHLPSYLLTFSIILNSLTGNHPSHSPPLINQVLPSRWCRATWKIGPRSRIRFFVRWLASLVGSILTVCFLSFITIIYHTNRQKSRDNGAHRSTSYSHLNSDNMARLLLRLSLISRAPPPAAFVKRFILKARGVQTRPKHVTSLVRSSPPILFRKIRFYLGANMHTQNKHHITITKGNNSIIFFLLEHQPPSDERAISECNDSNNHTHFVFV